MDEVKEIAKLYLKKLRKQMDSQGKAVEITENAINLLTEKGFSPKYGARFLKRYIDEKVKLPITTMWKQSSRFFVDDVDGEIVVKPIGTMSLN
jgi:ATP-dependent Clp protease ATP-binding subunit ClpA